MSSWIQAKDGKEKVDNQPKKRDNYSVMDELTAITELITQQKLSNTIEYRLARSRQELEAAYSLVYKEYLARGYINESVSKLNLSIYNALPQTATFVAVLEKKIFCTAHLILDSRLKLPMDELYHEELTQLRKQDKRLCEISMLACDPDFFKDGVSVQLNSKKLFFIVYLLKVIFDYVMEYLKYDCICIAINPKHKLTYDYLLFKDLGALKASNHVNNYPVIGKYLDLTTVQKECKDNNKEGLQRMFSQKNAGFDKFRKKFEFTMDDLQYFFVERTDIFRTSSDSQLDYIIQSYPTYNFLKILMN